MSKLPATLACGLYDRMLPLYAGQPQPAGHFRLQASGPVRAQPLGHVL